MIASTVVSAKRLRHPRNGREGCDVSDRVAAVLVDDDVLEMRQHLGEVL